MDPIIEVVYAEHSSAVFTDRFELPLFFIVGGVDDPYLSNLIGQPIQSLISQKSVDILSFDFPVGVYASRVLLNSSGLARVFPLSTFLQDRWPILSDIEKDEKDERKPSNVERTWIIRALKRNGYQEIANKVKNKMLNELYPEKVKNWSLKQPLTINTLSVLYTKLTEEQRNYPVMIIDNDLPVQLDLSIGDMLKQISVTGCTDVNLKVLNTVLANLVEIV